MKKTIHVCEWCGEPETPTNPVRQTLVSPPVSGYPVNLMWIHQKECSMQAAMAEVE